MYYRHETPFNASQSVVFDYLLRPGIFERLCPPSEPIDIIAYPTRIDFEQPVCLRIHLFPGIGINWTLRHRDFVAGSHFFDEQVSGPFQSWQHRHAVEARGESESVVIDELDIHFPFSPAFFPLGEYLVGRVVKQKLGQLFAYRKVVMDLDLDQIQKGKPPMKILVTGATGLVGSALVPMLSAQGHSVSKLVRRASSDKRWPEILWNPETGELDKTQLEGFDAVVHLAGENIASGYWTAAKKQKIRDSRVKGTQVLCETLASLDKPPKVLVSASAIGFYGNRGDVILDEASAQGDDFMAKVCREWEAACEPAKKTGIRVVNARFGIILSPRGGALAKVLPIFKLAAGGNLSLLGKQYWSWIAIDDVVGGIAHVLQTETLSGPVNLVSPTALTNASFTKTLASVLKRPALFPAPALALKLLLGEFADAVLLASTRVQPKALLDSGYTFQFPELSTALKHLLGR